ncbi:MAG: hypothetical protein HZB26_12575 [Candidatus Hydrogenedentes bacterium]|nr:hypothetical protein [Candidatus Hydrogenedentota bacterium]
MKRPFGKLHLAWTIALFPCGIISNAWSETVLKSSDLVVALGEQRQVSVALKQEADYAGMPIRISSDQKEADQRYAEVRELVELIQKKAQGNADILVASGAITLATIPASKTVSKSLSNYGDPSYSEDALDTVAQLHILVPFKGKNRDMFTCAQMVDRFIREIAIPGKGHIRPGGIQLVADNPEQYRPELLRMISDDVTKTREKLGAFEHVRISGLESQVLVRRTDDKNIELFINYQLELGTK